MLINTVLLVHLDRQKNILQNHPLLKYDT
ncbi:hypothetical protein TSAR_011401 [Trichomalopsis sarcophagae]|uniref:Uncharacterized protein n=1 Tax=Trichomalopsis sarcophagae TaxID=543379 RepID=A0A232EFH1_9HYME|nr:hypothetical protein TSAR_011401 [Trichomalopsis sarcophagae]